MQLGSTQLVPSPASNAVQPNAEPASSVLDTNEASISALREQVAMLTQALQAQTTLVSQLRAAQAPMPIAPPPRASPAINALGGAALSAPQGSQRSAVAPMPQQVLPAGMPPLPLSRPGVLPPGSPYVYNIGSQRSRQSGSSESSSDSDVGAPPPTPYPQCRICGDFHDEINCPYLTMNDPYGGGHAPEQEPDQLLPEVPRNYADEEDDTIRVKSLNDLVFPGPPENAGQARGYVNQVLMAIGKLQKTPGSEVYQWAQECLTSGEAELKADPRFPRTDREIASKLLKLSVER